VVEEEVARAVEEVVEFLGCLEDGGAGLFEMWGQLEVDGAEGIEGGVREVVGGKEGVEELGVVRYGG
jgi:hypothetical protein